MSLQTMSQDAGFANMTKLLCLLTVLLSGLSFEKSAAAQGLEVKAAALERKAGRSGVNYMTLI